MGGCCGGLGWFGGFGWLGAFMNFVILLALLGGMVWFVIWLVRRAGYGKRGGFSRPLFTPPPAGAADDPKTILKARYARGEITRDQYLQMIRDLENSGGTL